MSKRDRFERTTEDGRRLTAWLFRTSEVIDRGGARVSFYKLHVEGGSRLYAGETKREARAWLEAEGWKPVE